MSFFQHGVASGDPLPTAVVLWTRVTPSAEATPGSGKGPAATVSWQVATDARFRSVVAKGTVRTSRSLDHTVKVDAKGLKPATRYYYRFKHAGRYSPVGRTKTAPSPTSTPARLRLGVVSCANYEAGYFSAYRHLADHELDAVVHLGDYIYEYGTGEYAMGQQNTVVRKTDPAHEIVSLADYRRRHARYKTDPDLRTLHARFPFITTWDDHESANDAYAGGAENHDAREGSWLARRAAAYRAYDEWMPVRMGGTAAVGDGSRLYRRFRFGRLAELSLLDLRTYRSAPGGTFTDVPDPDDPGRTIAGATQLGWLEQGLATAEAQWKLVGNPVMIAPVLVPPLPNRLRDALEDMEGLLPPEGVAYNSDQWDGYTADRRRVLEFLADQGITDTVFLTGDIHSAWACDLPTNPGAYPVSSASVATELVCSSVTSNNLKDILGAPPYTASTAVVAGIQAANRHVRYLDFDCHGYSVLDVTPERAHMDWWVISDRADKNATKALAKAFDVRASTQKVRPSTTSSEGAA